MKVQFMLEEGSYISRRMEYQYEEEVHAIDLYSGGYYPSEYDEYGECIKEEYFPGYEICEVEVPTIDKVVLKMPDGNYYASDAEKMLDKDGNPTGVWYVTQWTPLD